MLSAPGSRLWPTAPQPPSPRLRGEGRGEGQAYQAEELPRCGAGSNSALSARDRCGARSHQQNSCCGHDFAAGSLVVSNSSARSPSIATTSTSFCRERRLIIELDGGQHSERPEDGHRDSELSALGYRVIRIWNNDVIENLDGVLETLLSELEKSPLTPALSPQAGRGR